MNKLKITAGTTALLLLGGTGWLYKRAEGKEAPAYRTVKIARGSLKSTVSATGALSAVRTVQVGTQVSGQVAQIYVDFNDHVKKGQLLARIDPTLQEQAVADAQAQLERAEATLTQAQSEYERNKQLFDAKVITASEFGTVQSNFSVQQAQVKSARIALDRARQNLSYTDDSRTHRRRDRRAQRGRWPDGGSQPFRAAALSDRQQFVRDADPRIGGRERHRSHQGRTTRAVHGAVICEPEPSPVRCSRCAAVEDAGQRGQLHRRGEVEERDRQAAPGHDGDRAVPDRRRGQRTRGSERGAASQGHGRDACGRGAR
jgi:multidrug efflux pump subunit AcrA (membrane-fusion protein)